MDEFESFTREKISRLRAEADALERTLKDFQAARNRLKGATQRAGPDQPRAGAFGVVLEAILASAREGLNLDQMIEAAEQQGYEVKRPTLRAQVWKAKEDGTLVQMEPGRYRSSLYDDFAGVSVPSEAARQLASDFRPKSVIDSPAGGGSILDTLDDEIPF
jgi:hypothetical protein